MDEKTPSTTLDRGSSTVHPGGGAGWRKRFVLIGLAALVGLGLAGAVAARIASNGAGIRKPPRAAPAIPVDTAVARRDDVPVLASGLGTVQAYNTVTVRVRVDGELQKVLFTEGQEVKAGQWLAQIDPRPFQAALDAALAKKVSDAAQLANAQRDLARDIPLAATHNVSQQQLDTQRALVAQLQGTMQGDDAAIESARLQLGYTRITAPIAGRVGLRLVDAGNMVHATDTNGLVTITQVRPISVLFTLPEDTLPQVNKGRAGGALPVTAFARNRKDVLGKGTLSVVDNEIDQATGTIRLKATFPNQDDALWPGQFVVAQLLLDTRRGVVTIPSIAVQRGASGLYVYVVKPDSTVALRKIESPDIGSGTAVVASGLAAGERVVTAGQYRLEPGAKVAWH